MVVGIVAWEVGWFMGWGEWFEKMICLVGILHDNVVDAKDCFLLDLWYELGFKMETDFNYGHADYGT